MIRLFSSGGGVQSAACLVLSARRKIDFSTHIFANVGPNAENPATIDYIADVLVPFAKANGIEWVEVSCGTDLYDATMSSEKSIQIPVRMSGSGAPGNRSCTTEWKIRPIAKYLKALIPPSTEKPGKPEPNQKLMRIAWTLIVLSS